MAVDFYGPQLKVKRAQQHIDELSRIFEEHVANQRSSFTSRGQAPRVFGPQFPDITAAVIGDAVHNLRASLDHAYCILVEANLLQVADNTYFPFQKEENGLRERIYGKYGQKPAPCRGVVEAIVQDIQPFEGGKLELYGLHRLDRTDKHRVFVPATFKASLEGKTIEVIRPSGVPFRWIGGTFITPHGPKGAAAVMSFEDDAEIKVDGDLDDVFDICFADGEPFEGQSILTKLRELKDATSAALEILSLAAE